MMKTVHIAKKFGNHSLDS